MFESFDSERNRYASVGVVSSMPGELIDSIWFIIDLDLKGVIPLDNILAFDIVNNHGKVTMHFSQPGSSVEIYLLHILVSFLHKFMLMMMVQEKRFFYLAKSNNTSLKIV